MADTSVNRPLSKLADALEIAEGYVVLTDAVVAIPAGVVALDAVDVDAAMVVCRTEDVAVGRVVGEPSLVVDLDAGGKFPKTRRLAWLAFGAAQRWYPSSDGGLVVETRGGTLEVAAGGSFHGQGPGWSCEVAVDDLFAAA